MKQLIEDNVSCGQHPGFPDNEASCNYSTLHVTEIQDIHVSGMGKGLKRLTSCSWKYP
jgi:hypothetical protein